MAKDFSVSEYVGGLQELFSEIGKPSLVPGMEAYMKHRFEYYGVKSVPRKVAQHEFYSTHGLPGTDHWKPVVKALWEYPKRELHYTGMDIAERCRKHWKEDDLSFLEYMIVTNSWWDSVDFIASHLIGHYMKKFPAKIAPTIQSWKTAENLWLRRTALIFQLKYREQTDFGLLKDVIQSNLGSKEFFINKAIGWSFRQYAYTDPEAVLTFVEKTDLAPLSKREAVKNLKSEQ